MTAKDTYNATRLTGSACATKRAVRWRRSWRMASCGWVSESPVVLMVYSCLCFRVDARGLFHECNCQVDVAAGRLRIGARSVGLVDQALRGRERNAGHEDVEAGAEEVTVFG